MWRRSAPNGVADQLSRVVVEARRADPRREEDHRRGRVPHRAQTAANARRGSPPETSDATRSSQGARPVSAGAVEPCIGAPCAISAAATFALSAGRLRIGRAANIAAGESRCLRRPSHSAHTFACRSMTRHSIGVELVGLGGDELGPQCRGRRRAVTPERARTDRRSEPLPNPVHELVRGVAIETDHSRDLVRRKTVSQLEIQYIAVALAERLAASHSSAEPMRPRRPAPDRRSCRSDLRVAVRVRSIIASWVSSTGRERCSLRLRLSAPLRPMRSSHPPNACGSSSVSMPRHAATNVS